MASGYSVGQPNPGFTVQVSHISPSYTMAPPRRPRYVQRGRVRLVRPIVRKYPLGHLRLRDAVVLGVMIQDVRYRVVATLTDDHIFAFCRARQPLVAAAFAPRHSAHRQP